MPKKKSDPAETPTFEEAQQELLELVEAMESGEIPLQELVDKYQSGMNLLKICRDHLAESELKIQKVQENNGTISLEEM